MRPSPRFAAVLLAAAVAAASPAAFAQSGEVNIYS